MFDQCSLEQGGGRRGARWQFRTPDDLRWQGRSVGRSTQGRLLLKRRREAPLQRQPVGCRTVRTAKEGHPHLKAMGHGVTINEAELEVAQLPMLKLEVEHGLQVRAAICRSVFSMQVFVDLHGGTAQRCRRHRVVDAR